MTAPSSGTETWNNETQTLIQGQEQSLSEQKIDEVLNMKAPIIENTTGAK